MSEEYVCREVERRHVYIIGHQRVQKSVELATRRQQVAPPAFADYWAPKEWKSRPLSADKLHI